jgi:excisionase family DNA binding protein
MYDEVREMFRSADELARQAGAAVSADHILLAVLRSGPTSGASVLRDLGITEGDVAAPAPGGSRGRRMWGPDIQPIIQASGEEARRLGSRLTRSAHLVLGLAASGQGSLPRLMAARGVTIEALRDLARRAIAATPEPGPSPQAETAGPATGGIGQAFFTVDQAAQFLGIHHQTLRGYIKGGKLPAYRLAGEKVLRIKREDLMALLEPVLSTDVGDGG